MIAVYPNGISTRALKVQFHNFSFAAAILKPWLKPLQPKKDPLEFLGRCFPSEFAAMLSFFSFPRLSEKIEFACHHCIVLWGGAGERSSLGVFRYIFLCPMPPVPTNKAREKWKWNTKVGHICKTLFSSLNSYFPLHKTLALNIWRCFQDWDGIGQVATVLMGPWGLVMSIHRPINAGRSSSPFS